MSDLALHFSSARADWATPWWLVHRCAGYFCLTFDLDVCATVENAKAPRFWTPEDDALTRPWRGNCWLNPPYGREIGKWTAYAAQEAQRGANIVCLLPARTDTAWWHDDVVSAASAILFLRGRLRFEGAPHSAPFPSAIAYMPAGGCSIKGHATHYVDWRSRP